MEHSNAQNTTALMMHCTIERWIVAPKNLDFVVAYQQNYQLLLFQKEFGTVS